MACIPEMPVNDDLQVVRFKVGDQQFTVNKGTLRAIPDSLLTGVFAATPIDNPADELSTEISALSVSYEADGVYVIARDPRHVPLLLHMYTYFHQHATADGIRWPPTLPSWVVSMLRDDMSALVDDAHRVLYGMLASNDDDAEYVPWVAQHLVMGMLQACGNHSSREQLWDDLHFFQLVTAAECMHIYAYANRVLLPGRYWNLAGGELRLRQIAADRNTLSLDTLDRAAVAWGVERLLGKLAPFLWFDYGDVSTKFDTIAVKADTTKVVFGTVFGVRRVSVTVPACGGTMDVTDHPLWREQWRHAVTNDKPSRADLVERVVVFPECMTMDTYDLRSTCTAVKHYIRDQQAGRFTRLPIDLKTALEAALSNLGYTLSEYDSWSKNRNTYYGAAYAVTATMLEEYLE